MMFWGLESIFGTSWRLLGLGKYIEEMSSIEKLVCGIYKYIGVEIPQKKSIYAVLLCNEVSSGY